MFERIPQDGSVDEAGLVEIIEEEKGAGKLPSSFKLEDIVIDRFVKEANVKVSERLGLGCE